MVTVMIRFTAFVRINVPSLVNAPLEFIFVNKRPDSNEFLYWVSTLTPHSNKHLCSVPVITLLEYIYTAINVGSSAFNCTLKVPLRRGSFVPASQLLCPRECAVPSIDDLVFKFCDECLARCSSQEGSRDNKSVFQSSRSTIKALFRKFCCFT